MVENVYVTNETKKTPAIEFNTEIGELRIVGKSLPEYSYAFYGKIIDDVDEYIPKAKENTTLIFNLDYINTISSKLIMRIILRFEKLLKLDKKVKVLWYYQEDDDMMLDMGQVYQSTTKIPVELIKL